jgi:pilus assembly protein CpaB
MNRKSLGMLILAVVCGLGAMYGTNQLLSKDRGPKSVEMQEVLVAVRSLKLDEVIKKDMVKTTSLAKEHVPAGAFTSVEQVLDRSIQIPMLADEPIVDAKLAPKGTPPGLISRIAKGMRAFAIEVNEQTAVSGFVMPGHRVDIVQSLNQPGAGQPSAEVILENVLVLAAGQTFTRPEDKSILSHTVTLAVTPEQVDSLVAARVRGPLTLSLRGLNDDEIQARVPKPRPPAPLPPALAIAPDPVEIEKKKPQFVVEDAPPPRPRRKIVFFRGLQSIEVIKLLHADESRGFALSDQVSDPE